MTPSSSHAQPSLQVYRTGLNLSYCPAGPPFCLALRWPGPIVLISGVLAALCETLPVAFGA